MQRDKINIKIVKIFIYLENNIDSNRGAIYLKEHFTIKQFGK